VEETLEPLDPDRRAFRLVGGVLVRQFYMTFWHFTNSLEPHLSFFSSNIIGRTHSERGAAHSQRTQSQRKNLVRLVLQY
jgi:hypothetical protein